ncbi:MAG: LysM peptidoglycan-binding domain-containing protein [Nitrospira sp.]|nr:LysM peptidoglycan-binding domain-containing protein [Nitrospira sp.]MBX3349028.1 LysM peptidoglycan-binding domain-containing protein [Nitrospira sp.]
MECGNRHRGVALVVLVTVVLGGCATAPEVSMYHGIDEAGRALQLMQEREKELAALRAEMATTRIAAAKQDAELHELRTTVVQLRQENGESHQALVEARRTLDTRETEMASLKTQREHLIQASTSPSATDQRLAELQSTVASLSQELAAMKFTMALARRTPGDSAERHDDQERIIPAVHVLPDDRDQSKPSWITVQPGESWWTLARKHKTTMTALRAVNGRVGDHLTVGEALRLP